MTDFVSVRALAVLLQFAVQIAHEVSLVFAQASDVRNQRGK